MYIYVQVICIGKYNDKAKIKKQLRTQLFSNPGQCWSVLYMKMTMQVISSLAKLSYFVI